MMQKSERLGNTQESSVDQISFELGWFCAAIEGEGSITLTGRLWKHKKYNMRSLGISPIITLSNLKVEFLDFASQIASRFGSPGHRYATRYDHKRTTVQHRLEWLGPKRCLKVLDQIEPYLLIKKSQAAVVREFCEIRLSKSIKARFGLREYQLFQQSRALHPFKAKHNPELEKRLTEILRDFTSNGDEPKIKSSLLGNLEEDRAVQA
jgi:hypothetical protein